MSPGYRKTWHVQFPKDIRAEGVRYVVEGVREATRGGFYRAYGEIKQLVPGEGAEDDLVGPVGRLAELPQPPADYRPGGEEGQREHQPEGLQGDWADVEVGVHA